MEEFLTQLQKLPAVWIPFVIALGFVGTFIWKVAERIHQSRSDAHTARESASERRIQLLEQQIQYYDRRTTEIGAAQAPVLPNVSENSAPLPHTIDMDRVQLPVTVTPKTIFSEMADTTSLEAQRRLQPYLGKWMTLSGVITDVLEPGRDGSVSIFVRSKSLGEPIIPEFMISDVIANFDRLPDSLEVARKKDPIRLTGQVGRTLVGSLTLDHCELI